MLNTYIVNKHVLDKKKVKILRISINFETISESPISKESSSTSQQIQQLKPLGKPTLQTMKRLSIDSQNSKSGSSIDSNLSEAASGSRSNNKNKSDPEVMPVERSLTKTNSVQRPPGSVPRTSRPSSARNLSSTLTKEAKIFEASTTSGT